ncbi:hydrophobin Hfbi with detergent, partial [Trichoderma citrinoviride]
GPANLCPGFLYGSPQCCDTSVLGVLDLSCDPPSRTPADFEEFNAICQENGRQAQCCVIPLAGQALLCQNVPAQ